VGAERAGELDAHVPEAAEADDADLLAGADAAVAERRIGGDAGAEERCGSGEIEMVGDAHDEALVDDDAVGVAAVGDAAAVLVGRAVGGDGIGAELLEAGLARFAGAVGVDEAADADEVARLVPGDRGADLRHAADDLVAGDDRVDGGDGAPLVAHEVEVGVADAGEEDLDGDVGVGRFAAGDGGGDEGRGGARGGVGFGGFHDSLVLCDVECLACAGVLSGLRIRVPNARAAELT
jgi:hypothetical protein